MLIIFYPSESGNYAHVFSFVVGFDTQKFGFLMDNLIFGIDDDYAIGRDARVAPGATVGVDLNLHDI